MTDTSKMIFDNIPILIIDEIDLNHAILTDQLSPYGLSPICLTTPAEGLSVLKRARERGTTIPIIVCDYYMPGMNGLEFVETIRNHSDIDGTQIILLTATHLGGLIHEFRDLNVYHILERPCSTHKLIRAIGDYVPTRRDLTTPRINDNVTPLHGTAQSDVRILAADDDAANRLVIKEFLNISGYHVDLVNNGREAVKMFKDNLGGYDLVLMDISMPVMDGIVATRTIRNLEERSGQERTPIIAVTAHAHPSQWLIYEDAGMDDKVTKPMRKRAFDAVMIKWCPYRYGNKLLVNG